ncbi:MAG: exonuclease SbcCD subunit D C-terminal domain-containing protein [Deltaproteobacteria bacterium]|nr:exonuclease SbcCD subunit D C-terminal domain-containing protein [Deltaproteobacteria bacterium]
MKIIHTSDWHLGRYLNKTKKRYDEFSSFLEWLAKTIEERQAEALIVAGDVFDNTTPTHRAQELYYSFLRQVTVGTACCRHVVVVGGNHDSPSFLEAPSRLLRGLGVHVLGASTGDPAREVLELRDLAGNLEMVVCAVPFLRESDLRLADLGESQDDRYRKTTQGLAAHYQAVRDLAQEIVDRNPAGPVPVVGTGHLFLAGSSSQSDDGVREIHAGPLEALPLSVLPRFDYLALGHIHSPQIVAKTETARYSGSPIPMGFNEAAQGKIVCLVDFGGDAPAVEPIRVPVFQELRRLEGDLDSLVSQVKALGKTQAWLELVHTGSAAAGDIRGRLEKAAEGTGLEILTVRDNRLRDLAMAADDEILAISDLSLVAVFDRLLEDHKIPEAERPPLQAAYSFLISEIESQDVLAE